jgi:hypothetical protein
MPRGFKKQRPYLDKVSLKNPNIDLGERWGQGNLDQPNFKRKKDKGRSLV